MQDAGWLDNVKIFNVAGQWQARLTYQGNLWLDASSNESVMKRIKQEIQNHGIRAANTVVAETIKRHRVRSNLNHHNGHITLLKNNWPQV